MGTPTTGVTIGLAGLYYKNHEIDNTLPWLDIAPSVANPGATNAGTHKLAGIIYHSLW